MVDIKTVLYAKFLLQRGGMYRCTEVSCNIQNKHNICYRATKIIREPEHLFQEDIEGGGLVQLGEVKDLRRPHGARGFYKQEKDRPFTQSDGFKLKEERMRLEVRRVLYPAAFDFFFRPPLLRSALLCSQILSSDHHPWEF